MKDSDELYEWIQLLKNVGFKIRAAKFDGLWDSPYSEKITAFPQHIFFKFQFTLLFSSGFHLMKNLERTLLSFLISSKKPIN